MATCDRECVRTARARKRSFRTGGGCDLMRARRRRWQIRVWAGLRDMRSEVARQKFESSHALQRACGCVYAQHTSDTSAKRIGMIARARRRDEQAEHRPQLGCTLSQISRLAHERSTSSEMNTVRCQNQMPYGPAGAYRMIRRLLARFQSAQP